MATTTTTVTVVHQWIMANQWVYQYFTATNYRYKSVISYANMPVNKPISCTQLNSFNHLQPMRCMHIYAHSGNFKTCRLQKETKCNESRKKYIYLCASYVCGVVIVYIYILFISFCKIIHGWAGVVRRFQLIQLMQLEDTNDWRLVNAYGVWIFIEIDKWKRFDLSCNNSIFLVIAQCHWASNHREIHNRMERKRVASNTCMHIYHWLRRTVWSSLATEFN